MKILSFEIQMIRPILHFSTPGLLGLHYELHHVDPVKPEITISVSGYFLLVFQHLQCLLCYNDRGVCHPAAPTQADREAYPG